MRFTPTFFVLFFFSFSISLFADDPKLKLTWGQEYQLPKKHFDAGFLGNTTDGYIQLGHQYGKSLSLQKFSTSLKLTSERLIDLKAIGKDYMTEEWIEWNGKTYWMYSTWSKKEGRERLFVQQIDIKKGDLQGNAKEMIQCEKVSGTTIATGFYQFAKANKFKISFASDSSKMYVYVKYPNESRNDAKNYEKYGFWVFNNNFNVIWSKEIKMPYTEKKMMVYDTQGDRDGNFLFLTKVFNDDSRKEIRDNAINFHFEILKFSEESKTATSIPFEFEDKYVSQLSLLEDLQGKIVCSGFYSAKDKNGKLKAYGSKVDGSFFLRLDTRDNKLVNIYKGFYEIPGEIFKQYESERTRKRMDKAENKGEDLSAFNMKLRNVVFNSDGSLLLVGEEHYIVVITHTNGKYTYTTTEYFYNDLLCQYIDGNGNLVYTKKIPKAQMGGSSFGLGFKLLPYNGSNYVFFMDNIKNLNLPPTEAPAGTSYIGVLMAVRLDETGNMQKLKVFDVREMKEKINIVGADRVGPNTLIDRVWDRKISKICLINIE